MLSHARALSENKFARSIGTDPAVMLGTTLLSRCRDVIIDVFLSSGRPDLWESFCAVVERQEQFRSQKLATGSHKRSLRPSAMSDSTREGGDCIHHEKRVNLEFSRGTSRLTTI